MSVVCYMTCLLYLSALLYAETVSVNSVNILLTLRISVNLSDFDCFFKESKLIDMHQTRLSSKSLTYALPQPRTTYGVYIRFTGRQIWNSLAETLKMLNRKQCKNKLQAKLLIITISNISVIVLLV